MRCVWPPRSGLSFVSVRNCMSVLQRGTYVCATATSRYAGVVVDQRLFGLLAPVPFQHHLIRALRRKVTTAEDTCGNT